MAHVLIVGWSEWSRSLIDYVTNRLMSEGYTVDEVSILVDAQEKIRTIEYDLIVANDIGVVGDPEQSLGIELIQFLESDQNIGKMPLILVTFRSPYYDEHQHLQKMFSRRTSGILRFLPWPFHPARDLIPLATALIEGKIED